MKITPAARFYLFGNAVSLCVGFALIHYHKPAPFWALLVIAMLIASVSYRLWLSPPVKAPTPPPVDPHAYVAEADPSSMPRYDSRRWARACFHNGIITLEELNAFYATHPERMSDPDR